jgi:hypothetical protein
VKQLLIQIFTVDKQIQKTNRCVLQMHLTKITSLVMRRIRGGPSREEALRNSRSPGSRGGYPRSEEANGRT